MTSANLYVFDSEGYNELTQKRLVDLSDVEGENIRLKSDLRHFIGSIVDLIIGDQQEKLSRRGYVFVVSGTWGAGKSTATWALVNEISDKLKETNKDTEPLLVVDKSLLPFGNASESITTFLNSFAQKLWSEGLLDVRAEINRFILEVTPNTDGKYSITAAVGPLSLTKPISKAAQSVNTKKLHSKFKRLVKLNKAVVIVLDDLDRLRPVEIVDVMRMVEKLRALPGVIVVLPIYKRIVTDAFEKDLGLQASSAATFLRKLTDAEVFVENGKEVLKQMFLDCFSEDTNNRFGAVTEKYGLSVSELCWYMLLHNLLIEEALESIRSEGEPTGNNTGRLFDGTMTQYIRGFREMLQESSRNGTPAPYPTHALVADKAMFIALGDYYPDIKDNSDAKVTTNRLAGLLRFDEINKAITTEATVIAAVSARQPTEFSGELEAKSSAPIFVEVLLKLLQKDTDEPLLTENYKLRDMKILAQRIQGDPNFVVDAEPLRTLYGVVNVSFRRFRF